MLASLLDGILRIAIKVVIHGASDQIVTAKHVMTNWRRYLNTMAAAEQLYDAVYQWKHIGSITITSTSLAFFKDVYSSAAVGTYASSSTTFTLLINAVSAYADSYMANAVSLVTNFDYTGGCLHESSKSTRLTTAHSPSSTFAPMAIQHRPLI